MTASHVLPGGTVDTALPTRPWWHRRARHVCVAQDTGRQVFAPARRFEASGFTNPHVLEDLLYGFTLIDQVCACGERRQQHLTGRLAQ